MSKFNTYQSQDGTPIPCGVNVVFISHRQNDKTKARALARFFEELGLHYWLDENDIDLHQAVKLGMAGEAAVVHAIERGIKHATTLIGLLSPHTVGSWWVPYEIGFSRALKKGVGFVALDVNGQSMMIPEYIRVSPFYSSADELACWACGLTGWDVPADLAVKSSFVEISRYFQCRQRSSCA